MFKHSPNMTLLPGSLLSTGLAKAAAPSSVRSSTPPAKSTSTIHQPGPVTSAKSAMQLSRRLSMKVMWTHFQFKADAAAPSLLSNTGTAWNVASVTDWATGVLFDGKVQVVRNGDDWFAGDETSQATYTLAAN